MPHEQKKDTKRKETLTLNICQYYTFMTVEIGQNEQRLLSHFQLDCNYEKDADWFQTTYECKFDGIPQVTK
jgi:hypothetical protein